MESVAELLSAAMDKKGLSLRDVQKLTEEHGHKVSFSTVGKIVSGKLASPKRETLRSLSIALNIPLRRLERAASLKELGTPFVLPDYASRLSAAEREAIRNLVRVMADSKDETNDHPDESQESRDELQARRERRDDGPEQKIAAYEQGLDGIDPDAFENHT